MAFSKGFMIGAATAAHQVEGNNVNSDYWIQEQLPHTSFTEPSGEACDHYNRYEEDIKLLADAGLNAYRFSIEWARIEPEEGQFDEPHRQGRQARLARAACGKRPLRRESPQRPRLPRERRGRRRGGGKELRHGQSRDHGHVPLRLR